LDDRITFRRRQARRTENKVVSKDQVGRPRRVVGSGDHCVEIELAQRGVDAVYPKGLVSGKRLVVSHAAESRLRIVRSGWHGGNQVPDVLIKEWHLGLRVGVIERDGVVQGLAGHGHPNARVEVSLHVIPEIEAQHQEFTGTRAAVRKREASGIQVNDGRARISERLEGGLERGHHRLWRGDEWIKAR